MYIHYFVFRACILRFNDCPLCGADIDKVEPDPDLQALVDQFIEGHARIKRSVPNSDDVKGKEEQKQFKNVTYEDVSLERGSFLLQHVMRVSWEWIFINCHKFFSWKDKRILVGASIFIHDSCVVNIYLFYDLKYSDEKHREIEQVYYVSTM